MSICESLEVYRLSTAGKSYGLIADHLSWQEGHHECRKAGGLMVKTDNEYENLKLNGLGRYLNRETLFLFWI